LKHVYVISDELALFLYREATVAAQKAYERMNDDTAPFSNYQPGEVFTYNTEGIPGTTGSDSLKYTEPYDEKQF